MFNSIIRDFEEDPFFSPASEPFHLHHERMGQMMSGFRSPFRHGFMPSITNGQDRGRREEGQDLSVAPHNRNRDLDSFRNPFAMMDSMRSHMRDRREFMHRNIEDMASNSNSHAFSSSSVMTYSKVGDEPAKVFKASSQTRCIPGGIKETRRTLKDSESGLEKMAIGHHINDRGHVIEKKHNTRTGEREFNQDFQNLDETEAEAFDVEWQQKVSEFQPSAQMSHLEAPRARAVHQAAIAGPEHTHRETQARPAESQRKLHVSELNIQGSSKKD
ncbi:myeloid leukemia factor 1 isoform X1 [Silurus meridionalis]|uniref:myeloid leukemia factor 1 isoform X1 n=1 Tax=Silurus meridionalis TaxID=175797 RepID=UPI001EEADF17|nr:myeloid leukemia factor 1 isoform X1 [Silurus meridionalis]